MYRVILLLLGSTAAAFAASPFATYSNERYGYSILYPATLLKQVQSREGEGGAAFRAVNGTAGFRVFAHPLEGRSSKNLADEAQQICPEDRPSYRVVKAALAAVSCETDDHIIYQKSLIRNGLEVTVRGEYPVGERNVWDPVVTSIARSMSTGVSP